MGVIPLKIQEKMPAAESESYRRMQGTEHRLEQLIRHCGPRSVRNSYETHKVTFSHMEIREKRGINYPKSKLHFFSLDRKEKIGVLRGYFRDKGPKNICWDLGLVRGHFAV